MRDALEEQDEERMAKKVRERMSARKRERKHACEKLFGARM